VIKDSGFTDVIAFAEANNVSKKLSEPFSLHASRPPAISIFAGGYRKHGNSC